MSRSHYNDDLAYGDLPQRWDRSRFERYGRGGPPSRVYEDDLRVVERERPGFREVAVADREASRGPGGRFEERDTFIEDERTSTPRRRRRTDRELFGDIDPRELAGMALTPYRRRSVTRDELDVEIATTNAPRPGLLRRQSSLDTFDRRPARETRVPPYVPVPLPVRRRPAYDTDGFREVEIERSRSVRKRRPAKSEATTVVKEEIKSVHHHESDSSSSSSSDEFEETVVRETKSRAPSAVSRSRKAPSVAAVSVHDTVVEGSAYEASMREERKFKKGKTRMPKRLVRREAIMDLGYPFDEDEDFLVLRIALEKEQIDEVIQISEQYKEGEKVEKKKIYRFEEKIEDVDAGPPPPANEREEIERTEWINPPTIIGGGRARSTIRGGSPSAKSSISRRLSPGGRSRRHSGTFVEERRTIVEERSPPIVPSAPSPRAPSGFFEERKTVIDEHPGEFFEERKTVVEERAPPVSLVLAAHDHRSDRDIAAEIRHLEAERRALRLERDADQKRDLALRLRERGATEEDFQLVEYRSGPRGYEAMEIVERDRSPPRNIIRVEKDRKERRNARLVAAAMATLT